MKASANNKVKCVYLWKNILANEGLITHIQMNDSVVILTKTNTSKTKYVKGRIYSKGIAISNKDKISERAQHILCDFCLIVWITDLTNQKQVSGQN